MPTASRLVFLVTLVAAAAPIKGMNRRLDNTTKVPYDSPDDQIKCGGCPCNNPCYTTSPPPPPPSPPPPKIPTPTPVLNCPPPPTGSGGSGLASPGYIYITGPPGDLYPVNPYFSGSHRNFWAAPPLLVVFVILGMLIVY
ncbi:hypothetical protein L1987_57479 [Smallanthus sonchifolius]|uniref:Uncharacterized protein n=1 Tax=Smallanthus sonchifolius TaxID=185202 RepID=A0ACB9DCL6_9ASTR|nr:hypothetical protein L1987_57479 [Smallanthus sonchifolius]